jgi:integrase
VVKRRRKPPSQHTYTDVAKAFAHPELSALSDRLITTITQKEIETIGETIKANHSQSAHRKFIIYTKAAFRQAGRKAGLSGLDQVKVPWWLQLETPPLETPVREERHLTPDELGLGLAVAEIYRRLPGRTLGRETSEIALCGLWWLAFTGQRRGAGLAVKKSWVVADPRRQGWSIVAFPPEVMKSRKPFTLPLPPAVTRLVERARAADKRGSMWLFPSDRSMGDVKDPKVNDSILTLLLRRLRGRDQIGRENQLGDLLEGIPEFSPHDLRDSLTTGLQDLTVRGDAISAVLDHESLEGGRRFRESEAAITRLAYDHSQQLELKRLALEPWVNLVIDAYETALSRMLPSLPNAVEFRPWHPRV